jgi:phosphoenolpyruvate phosphomutase
VTKTQQFRALLRSPRLEFLMEAHHGLSARIAEEAGFRGLWASGLSISAALGVRDNNEASWTQVLEVVEFMADATAVPILLDGDTGYGNFNNVRRLVQKLEQRGVAAVCLEDKLFPKTNSFINGERQPLADADEFAGKLKAVKDAQRDPDFAVVARIEAFIAGWGLDEMLRRAHVYADAGADALLIHSRKSTPDQILAFARAWTRPVPLVIVPTMYYSTPVEVFEQAGIRLVIWANHNARAAITAMQRVSRTIFAERSVANVEDQIAPVKEIFRLQDAAELEAAEDRYLPRRAETLNAIILAASRGSELGDATADRPKAMIPVAGVPLLHRLVGQFRAVRTKQVTVVRGYAKDQVTAPDAEFVDNDEFEGTGELLSLLQARHRLEGDVILSFGDILFRRYILQNLLTEEGDLILVADAAWQARRQREDCYVDYIAATRPHSPRYEPDEPVWLTDVGPKIPAAQVHGEWIGLLRATPAGTAQLRDALTELSARDDFRRLRFDDLLRHLLGLGAKIRVLYITGHWLDVDNHADLEAAQAFA